LIDREKATVMNAVPTMIISSALSRIGAEPVTDANRAIGHHQYRL
jgi:hypothetical protein